MALTPGTRLGVYDITAPIGAGGMGEVYRARDAKLDRNVAIKILPESFAHDADRLARFQREAKTLASLNHPNIAAIYGLEEGGGITALVMELVEGDDLSQRIARGAIPTDEALPIAKQIAEALEAAHEQGVIHRDLKPANIKVRADGTVKVLDFGLAKAMEPPAGSSPSASMSPTITSPAMTQAGIILGTAAYMSPEQARGKPADKRADIWAFGCVLYEMLTGTRAFGGSEISDTLAGILLKEPDWTALPPQTPDAIRRLLRRCLEKDAKERLPEIGSARLEIKDARITPVHSAPATVVAPRYGLLTSPRLTWPVAAAFATAAAIVTVLYVRAGPPDSLVTRFPVPPPKNGSFLVNGAGPRIALSPDGTQLAFIPGTSDGKPTLLWVRRMDGTEASPLTGTDGAQNPFWSPDSRSIAFLSNTQLKRIDLAGGPPQIVYTDPGGSTAAATASGAWNNDGTILFNAPQAAGAGYVLYRVAANGGTPTPATTLDDSRAELGHFWPRFLPDGRHFIYFAQSAKPENQAIVVGSLDSKETHQVLNSEFGADFAPPNHLLFRRGSALFAQTLNLETFQLEGEAVRIADPVGAVSTTGRPGFSVSDSGVLALWPTVSTRSDSLELTIHDRAGKTLLSLGSSQYRGIDVSPDGRRVATHLHDAGGDIWVLDLERGTRERFTFDASQDNSSPVWSRDGSRIAFSSRRDGAWGLYQKPSSGTGSEELLFQSNTPKAPLSYSPDGQSLLFENVDPKTRNDLWVLPLAAERKPVPYLQSPFAESGGQISPDGRWVAYASTESGRSEVYVQGLSNRAGKWQVSTESGLSPRWRHDGKELFFVFNNPGRVFAVSVEPAADGLRFGVPKALFDYGIRVPLHATPFFLHAVSGDGQRFFLTHVPAATDAAEVPLTVVLNWTAALRK